MESAGLSLYARCQEKIHTQCQTTKPKKSRCSDNALSSSCANGLIAPLVLETLPRGELTRRAQEIAARIYDVPHSIRRQVSVDTLLEWTLRYRRNGLDALHPKPRNALSSSCAK